MKKIVYNVDFVETRLMYPIEALKNDPNDFIAWYVLMEHGDVPYEMSSAASNAVETRDSRLISRIRVTPWSDRVALYVGSPETEAVTPELYRRIIDP